VNLEIEFDSSWMPALRIVGEALRVLGYEKSSPRDEPVGGSE
jgi:hypothetical protein